MQLTLPVQVEGELSFDNFIQQANHLPLIHHLKHSSTINSDNQPPITLLVGPTGCGKTHLLYAMSQYAQSQEKLCAYLSLSELISYPIDVLEGVEEFPIVCVDDVHKIAGIADWELAIFDLINRLLEKRHNDGTQRIVFSSNQLPAICGFDLRDLTSRLQWGTTFKLSAPSEEAKVSILNHRAKQKGLMLSDQVIHYLLNHNKRDLGSLINALDMLDIESLRTKKKLSVAMVKRVIGAEP